MAQKTLFHLNEIKVILLLATTNMLRSKVQLAPPTENVCRKAMAVLTPKSGIRSYLTQLILSCCKLLLSS